jgi:putative protease
MLSDYMTGRGANQGECAQSCRWSYELTEEKRPGERMPVKEDERGTYIFNSKDLKTINHIQEFIKIGIDSFKIEGRMKSLHYAAVTAAVYNKVSENFIKNPDGYLPDPKLDAELNNISHREYTEGFYFAKAGDIQQSFKSSDYMADSIYMGHINAVQDNNICKITAKNTIKIGDKIEIFTPAAHSIKTTVLSIKEIDGTEITHTKGEREYFIKLEMKETAEICSILRKTSIDKQ